MQSIEFSYEDREILKCEFYKYFVILVLIRAIWLGKDLTLIRKIRKKKENLTDDSLFRDKLLVKVTF